tara:strand:+ start:30 stop:263 length:234 start_codon:yes stop_codon:yes gene_type:complete
MWIEAVLKCDRDHTPYRVYINDELMTERFYTISPKTVSNNLVVELEHSPAYDIRVESLTDIEVILSEYHFKEKLNEN